MQENWDEMQNYLNEPEGTQNKGTAVRTVPMP